jgi:hypothetical protein
MRETMSKEVTVWKIHEHEGKTVYNSARLKSDTAEIN